MATPEESFDGLPLNPTFDRASFAQRWRIPRYGRCSPFCGCVKIAEDSWARFNPQVNILALAWLLVIRNAMASKKSGRTVPVTCPAHSHGAQPTLTALISGGNKMVRGSMFQLCCEIHTSVWPRYERSTAEGANLLACVYASPPPM
ncbi:uncharacterized protein CLUP02_13676 [Colletotrichum lupini]|uniref:Uncharacterized protein n=1 Tax=Colletotrichum lupini TaxID=145971 RepID=A0A9Q8T2X3_9PEZI|nr:uncharacterized protein CLUP02_13676 [Colletotrichum lupini]UQC88153.1 hypothetical protein CLUP02_13676 [Colletotrichum lupini]